MFRILILVAILVNSGIFCLGTHSQNSTVETCCQEALERFTDAILRTTLKALKVYADSTCETGSITLVPSLYLLGAFGIYSKGKTWNEISRIINLRSNEEIMCVTTILNKEAINITGCTEFAAAASIVANDRYPLTPAFIDTVEKISLDGFAKNFNLSNSKQSVKSINKKLAAATRNGVQTTITDNSIFNSSTELVAVSAVYLMSGWEIEFQRTNEVTRFRISPTESEPQTFMHQEAEYYYTHSKLLGAQVVQVNACMDQLSVWILLPDCPFTEGAVIDKMAENQDWHKKVKETMNMTTIDLYIPFYRKITTTDSAYALRKSTGIETIFNNKTIELKGVVEGDARVAVSAGVLTTYLSCTFKGNRKPGELPKGPKKTIKADYPFVFMIFRFGRVYFAGTFRRAVA